MIFYIIAAKNETAEVIKRGIAINQSGENRVEYISKTIFPEKITYVCCGIPQNSPPFEAKEEELNGQFYFYPEIRGQNAIYKLHYIVTNIVKYITQRYKEGDLVVSYNANIVNGLIVTKLKKVCKNVQIVLEIEELFSQSRNIKGKLRYLFESRIERKAISMCEAYIIVNENLTKFFDNSKPFIINSGYHETSYSVNSEKTVNSLTPAIVYCGRLDADGGVINLLNAMEYIDFNCRIIVTGLGELIDKVKKASKDDVRIEYKGLVSNDELSFILENASVCINPIDENANFTKYSFPSKIYEYMRHGNAIITSNVPSINMITRSYHGIYIISDTKPQTIAKEISRVISIAHSRTDLKNQYNSFSEKRFSEISEFWRGLL